MKKATSGVLYAPQSTGVHIPERVNALNEQVNNLQSRYYRSLAQTANYTVLLTAGISAPSFQLVQGLYFHLCL